MPKDKDKKTDPGEEFSLDAILAEFGSGASTPAAPAEGGPRPTQKPAEEGEKPAQKPAKAEKKPAQRAEKSTRKPAQPPQKAGKAPPAEDWEDDEDTIPFPVQKKKGEAKPAQRGQKTPPSRASQTAGAQPLQPKAPPKPPEKAPKRAPEKPLKETPRQAPKAPEKEPVVTSPKAPKVVPMTPRREPPQAEAGEGKVLEFPAAEPESPLAAGIEKLNKMADDFAGHMYEEEGAEMDPQVRRVERLVPGVDREEAPAPVRARRPRRQERPAPDLPPDQLAKKYTKGLSSARIRVNLAFGVLCLLLYLTLAESFPIPIPVALARDAALRCYALAGVQIGVILLCFDTFVRALAKPFRFRMGLDLLMALGNLTVLLDALTLPALSGGEPTRQPLCAAAAMTLWWTAWGGVQKQRGQRLACRTAAAASQPYRVTRDEGKWNGRDTYAKWSGKSVGFGSQIQASDGAERIFARFAPVLLCACILFAIIATLGKGRPRDILWALGAILTAASPLSAAICFGLPWRRLSLRLSKSGAALAGWEGAVNTTGGSNLLLGDADLFPPGSVSLNGVKVFGDISVDKVVSVTATVIRDSGSGLEKIFHDLLRSQGTTYRRGEKLLAYEGGGVSEIIHDELVLVGSAPFMLLMEVPLPPGLNVKNAVFCAIDGELQGIFALNYHLNPAVPYALDSLIHNRITPVLCTRDFNLIPSMLRQRFKLPVDKMEFPPIERRRELSAPDQDHSDALAALLCREGVGPYAEAVVGAHRLRTAVRMSAVLACLASVVGALLAFYLTFLGAYASLTTVNLLVFLLAWLVPAPLIAGWVDRY